MYNAYTRILMNIYTYIYAYTYILNFSLSRISRISRALALSLARVRSLSSPSLPSSLPPSLPSSPIYVRVAIRPLTQSHWSRRTWRKCGGVPRNQWTVSLHLVNSFEPQSHVSHCFLYRVECTSLKMSSQLSEVHLKSCPSRKKIPLVLLHNIQTTSLHEETTLRGGKDNLSIRD